MRTNNELKLHFINVNHGDATIIEFPDYGEDNTAHFGVIDFGAKLGSDRALTREYMKALVELRRDDDHNFQYRIDFACVTHPHDDHYGGLKRFMDEFADPTNEDHNKVDRFWDCGFRTNATNYNRVLRDIVRNPHLTFTRLAAGAEFGFGDTRITILAPSVDLRNRFDTYGINRNNASIILKIKYRRSQIIVAGDAQFASWGKTTEEFPRQRRTVFFEDALGLAHRDESSDQLRCNLLRMSHHGSKHGTSLEYLERLQPKYVVIPAGSLAWYHDEVMDWEGMFPHPLVTEVLSVLRPPIRRSFVTGDDGNLIFKYTGGWNPHNIASFSNRPDSPGFDAALLNNWP